MMGIKEEIEHLKSCRLRAIKRLEAICRRCERLDDYGCYYADPIIRYRVRGLKDQIWLLNVVLALLDRYELVAEGVAGEGEFLKERGELLCDVVNRILVGQRHDIIKPGDRIAIWKEVQGEREG